MEDDVIVGLPVCNEFLIGLIQQCEHSRVLDEPVKYLLGEIHFISEYAFLIRVLGRDDYAQLVDERDL